MSVQADQDSPSQLVELPTTWLAHLVQHVASGAGGLASAAALSQTCKSFRSLSESPAVSYRNLYLDKPLPNLGHPFFQWLSKRHGRIAGLTAELRLVTLEGLNQLQLMFSIQGLHLTLRYDAEIASPDDSFMTKVLRPHGHLIDHLTSVVCISKGRLKLQDFCKAAAPCRSLDLTVGSTSLVSSLHPLAALGSLGHLSIGGTFTSLGGLQGSLCTCLRSLRLSLCRELRELSGIEDLTALQQLVIFACGVTSLQPIGQLIGGLRLLYVHDCGMVEEEVLELPHIQSTAAVHFEGSNVKEVVLAEGFRRRVGLNIMVSSEEEEEEEEGEAINMDSDGEEVESE